jgi:hypothetical protein
MILSPSTLTTHVAFTLSCCRYCLFYTPRLHVGLTSMFISPCPIANCFFPNAVTFFFFLANAASP